VTSGAAWGPGPPPLPETVLTVRDVALLQEVALRAWQRRKGRKHPA